MTAPPLICLVADARWRHRMAACVAAGIDLIQIRDRTLPARDLADFAAEAVVASRASSTRVVVNDRVDIGLAVGADGVHLPGAGLPTAAVRQWAPRGWLVGRSVHSAEDAAAAGREADYLIFGTVFDTASKPGVPAQGLTALADAVRAAAPCLVLAIGGVTIANASACLRAGAAGLAGIGVFEPAAPVEALRTTVERLRAV